MPRTRGVLYMAGIVAEWVADVYRPIVDDEFNDFNYYRGNVYTKHAIGPDGTVEVVGVDDIIYDTLSNGKVVARNLPGEIVTVPITEEDTYLRSNFSVSDNRNFRDGDRSSTRYYEQVGEEVDPSQRMYNSPIHTSSIDSVGGVAMEYDATTGRTTLVDDQVRVYKGGSWRDRAYWLDPAQRRYFPQDMATDYIGFRNAMSRVGSKSLDENKTAGNN